MPKQYYAVLSPLGTEVLGWAKTNTPREAVVEVVGTTKAKGHRTELLGRRKQNAMEALVAIECEANRLASLHRAARIEDAEEHAREELQAIVKDHETNRETFLARLQKATSFAHFFEWDTAASVIASEYKAEIAGRILRLAASNRERHLFDWLFLSLRYELKETVEARHCGSQSMWRLATSYARAEARRDLLDGLSGITMIFFRGQRCIEAREDLGMDPPPWTKVNTAYVKTQFTVPGFEDPRR